MDGYDPADNSAKCYDLAIKTMRAQKALDRWSKIKPDAFLAGSIAQARNIIEEMQKDIAFLGTLIPPGGGR